MKSLIMYVVRTYGRPVFKEYKRTLAQDWNRSVADLSVVFHGGEPGPDEPAQLADYIWFPRAVGVDTYDRSQRQFTIAKVTAACVKHARLNGYEFFGLLDDDAEFKDLRALGYVLRQFKMKPRLGICGPLGSLQILFKFGKKRRGLYKDKIEMHGPPWAFGGCQIYRTEAVAAMNPVPFLLQLQRITDLYLFTGLYIGGWSIEGYNLPFEHRSSYMKLSGDMNPNWRKLLAQAHHDYPLILEGLEKHPKVWKSVSRVYRHQVRRYQKNIEALRTGQATDTHQTWVRRKR